MINLKKIIVQLCDIRVCVRGLQQLIIFISNSPLPISFFFLIHKDFGWYTFDMPLILPLPNVGIVANGENRSLEFGNTFEHSFCEQ